jgi:hypothetical protein
MSRTDITFTRADVSVDHLDDAKVRKLWRRLGDSSLMCEAVTVHLAVVLASWRSGRRITVHDATPIWLTISEGTFDALVEVGLLDRSGRIPTRSWSRHFDPALGRRIERIEAGKRGGKASAERRSSGGSAEVNPTNQPTIPTNHTTNQPSRGRARNGTSATEPVPLRDALIAAGVDPKLVKGERT